MSICLSYSLIVVLPLVSMFVFVFLSFVCFARALARLIVCECRRAYLRALSDCEIR